MPISASFSLASNRRFATWTSSAILLPFNAHRSPCPRLPGPATSRPLATFDRFTVEEAIENGDRATWRFSTRLGEVDNEDCVVDCARVEPQHTAPLRPLGFVLRVTT